MRNCRSHAWKVKSHIWKFFDKISPELAKCKSCSRPMKTNKARHLRVVHRSDYAKYLRLTKKYPMHKIASGSKITNRRSAAKRSKIWLFFEDIGKAVRCKICRSEMSHNFKRHLRAKHPKEYNQMEMLTDSKNYERNKFITVGWVRKHCKKVERGYECELCHKLIKTSSNNYFNIKRHIQSRHPFVYETELENFMEGNDDVEFEFEYLVDAKSISGETRDSETETMAFSDNSGENSDANEDGPDIHTDCDDVNNSTSDVDNEIEE